MKQVFDEFSRQVCKMLTHKYSTSFSLGIMCIDRNIRGHIYALYGFVRLADEIVYSFHEANKRELLQRLEKETWQAIHDQISINPVLQAFQETVNKVGIDRELIEHFLNSMKMDLEEIKYNDSLYKQYIHGSAEVVGLICLKIFVQGDKKLFEELKPYALRLGSAFQKVNFLRDIKQDLNSLGRSYFPNIQSKVFDTGTKKIIEEDIEMEFTEALKGILKLPHNSRFGVYLAFRYYSALFHKIKKTPASEIMKARIRINNFNKLLIFISSNLKYKFIISK